MSQFHLQSHLNDLYQQTEHECAFQADTPEAIQEWQMMFRDRLRQTLKIDGRVLPETTTSECIATTDKGTYIEEKHILHGGDVSIPMYLLIPKTEAPYEPVIAFHGHGMGVNLILGNFDHLPEAQELRDKDENFAQRLAEDGYFVCAIEQQGFGERVTDLKTSNSCRHLAFHYMLHDRTLLGERVWEGMLAISYLMGRDDLLMDQLGGVGFSGGGTTILFLSALDERIRRVVIAGYLCTMQQSILGVPHCECNYVPEVLLLGDTGDIAGLIAPRPMRAVSGEHDPIFPVAGVREQYQTVEAVYHALGVDTLCSLVIHPNGHQFNYDATLGWLQS